MRKTFKYRVYLSATATKNAERHLELCCGLYNMALRHRKYAYEERGENVSGYDQTALLPPLKKFKTEYKEPYAQVLTNVIARVDKAYKAFFRRCKSGEKPGFPRIKTSGQYDSMTFTHQGGWQLEGKKITFHNIGTGKLVLHRPIQGRIRTVTLKKDRCGDWYVAFSCDQVPQELLPETGKSLGVDVGISKFITTSDGESIENPRHLQKAEKELKRAQRRVSKGKKGSNRRRKKVLTLARTHRHVANARRYFHFNLARKLLEENDVVVLEDLNVRGMVRGRLAKHISDAGWGQFREILSSSAESLGRNILVVPPAYTSQTCSKCGHCEKENRKTQDKFKCVSCGHRGNADANAATNILRLGMTGSLVVLPKAA